MTKLTQTFLTLIATFIPENMVAYASGNAAADELKKLLTNSNHTGLMDIIQMAGFVIIAIGIGQMILAFKDDNAEQKARGSMVLLAGAFLVLIKTILQTLGAL